MELVATKYRNTVSSVAINVPSLGGLREMVLGSLKVSISMQLRICEMLH